MDQETFEQHQHRFKRDCSVMRCFFTAAFTLTAVAIAAFVFPRAPINRTLEVSAQSAEVPGRTTVTLQLHQDGSVTWQRPPTMDDQVWFLPKLGIQSIDVPQPAKPVPAPSPWVAQTLKSLEKYEYKIDK